MVLHIMIYYSYKLATDVRMTATIVVSGVVII